jgi:hypothetical protein
MASAVFPRRHLGRWLGGWAEHAVRRAFTQHGEGPLHVLFAFCDHFEPLWGGADDARGRERVLSWTREYPRLAREFRDADGRPPRHSFFFPAEQYRPEYLEALAELTREGFGEVELHLHHDGDTAERLRHDILAAVASYAAHGHLARDASGRLRYGFVHGNWCLANSRPDGRWCGVDSELEVLFETGCYADFTFPSAPDRTQPPMADAIYWPVGDLARRSAHETGMRARVGEPKGDRILLIQGPLSLARGGRFGVRIENGAITARDPATRRRVRSWINQAVQVEGRPDWIFVKVHTHGAPEAEAASLLGSGGRALHRALTESNDFVLHYVTAREMFNIALAGMQGWSGNPDTYRDHVLAPPGARS